MRSKKDINSVQCEKCGKITKGESELWFIDDWGMAVCEDCVELYNTQWSFSSPSFSVNYLFLH